MLLVGGDPEPHAGQGWKPASGLSSCSLSWAVALVSRAFGSWKCLEVKQSAEKPEPGSSQGTDPHHLSCGSWPSFPALPPGTLEPLTGRRWEKGGWAAAASPEPLVAFFCVCQTLPIPVLLAEKSKLAACTRATAGGLTP